jgi:hypothetical protein
MSIKVEEYKKKRKELYQASQLLSKRVLDKGLNNKIQRDMFNHTVREERARISDGMTNIREKISYELIDLLEDYTPSESNGNNPQKYLRKILECTQDVVLFTKISAWLGTTFGFLYYGAVVVACEDIDDQTDIMSGRLDFTRKQNSYNAFRLILQYINSIDIINYRDICDTLVYEDQEKKLRDLFESLKTIKITSLKSMVFKCIRLNRIYINFLPLLLRKPNDCDKEVTLWQNYVNTTRKRKNK